MTRDTRCSFNKSTRKVAFGLAVRLTTVTLHAVATATAAFLVLTAHMAAAHHNVWIFLALSLILVIHAVLMSVVFYSRLVRKKSIIELTDVIKNIQNYVSALGLLSTMITVMEQSTLSGLSYFVAEYCLLVTLVSLLIFAADFVIFYNLPRAESALAELLSKYFKVAKGGVHSDDPSSLDSLFTIKTNCVQFGVLVLVAIFTMGSYWYRLFRDCEWVVRLYGTNQIRTPFFTEFLFECACVIIFLLLVLVLYAVNDNDSHFWVAAGLVLINAVKLLSTRDDSYLFNKEVPILWYYLRNMTYVPTMRWLIVVFLAGVLSALVLLACYAVYDLNRGDL